MFLEVLEPEAEVEALMNGIGGFRREVAGEDKDASDGGREGCKEKG